MSGKQICVSGSGRHRRTSDQMNIYNPPGAQLFIRGGASSSGETNILNAGELYISGGGERRTGDSTRINIVNQPGAQLHIGSSSARRPHRQITDVSTQAVQDFRQTERRVEKATFDKCKRSVVKIIAINKADGSKSSGSGSIWDKEGHVVTNNHVVDGCDKLKVILHDGTRHKAVKVGRSKSKDLALLKLLDRTVKLYPVVLGSPSQKLYGTQPIFFIGHPLNCEVTAVTGSISGVLKGTIGTDRHVKIEAAIQLSAMVNPGNSGGPLFDSDSGQFIGVVMSSIKTSSGGATGIGFAIPLRTVVDKVGGIIQRERESKELAALATLIFKSR